MKDRTSELEQIKAWFQSLWQFQKDHLSSQVISILPTNLSTEEDDYSTLLEIIDYTIRFKEPLKGELLYHCLRFSIMYLLSEYPKTANEYLDWYQKRKNILPGGLKRAEHTLRMNQATGDLQSAHFNSMKHALATWEELDQKFEQEEEGI